MILPILLLLGGNTEEFSFKYEGSQKFYISGKFINGEWVVNVSVYSPMVIWGCNGYHTNLTSKNKVIGYFLMLFINQLSEYGVPTKNLLRLMKNVL